MKTTKKGFTLIELIVVIAIIGVLAAILVPTMLGYVRKSKISSANSAASSVYKGINSALTELDEEGVDVGGLYILAWDGSAWTGSGGSTSTDDQTLHDVCGDGLRFDKKVANFFADIKKLKAGQAAVKGGGCIAFAGRTDKTYTGTYPGGIVTTDSYTAYSSDSTTGLGDGLDEALTDAVAVAAGAKGVENSSATNGRMTFTIPDTADADYATLQGAVGTAGEVTSAS